MGKIKKKSTGVVYWAHLKEHTDPRTQGYIGYSSYFQQRKNKHFYNARTKIDSNPHFYNALIKYGADVIWEILFTGPILGCVQIEEYLRPAKNIGWNINVGGSTQLGVNHPRYGGACSTELRLKMRESALSRGTRIRCITTGEEFLCISDACKKYMIERSNLRKACKGIIRGTGTHPDTLERLKWEYI